MIRPTQLPILLFAAATVCVSLAAFLYAGLAAGVGALGACLFCGFLFSLMALI